MDMAISDRYNPLDYIEKESDAEQVATTITLNASDQGKNENDFWMRAEIALLKTLILYVKYECPHEATMDKIKEILTVQGRTPKRMDQFFSRLEPDHPAYRSYLIVRMAEDRTRASIFISLGITLSKFDSKDVRQFLSCSDFSFDDIGKKKMIIYCILPIADPTWEPLIASFFVQMFQRLYHVAHQNYNQLAVKVNFLLDEFVNIGKIPRYEEILATCRGYGISISTVVQSLGQLIDKYSKDKAEAIMGNNSLQYVMGVSDKFTAEYFSDHIGKTTIQTQSSSISKSRQGGSDSISDSYTGRLLITSDEIRRMKIDEGILLVSNMFPIQVKKVFQYQFFKGILNDRTSRLDYLSKREGKRVDSKDQKVINQSDLDRIDHMLLGIDDNMKWIKTASLGGTNIKMDQSFAKTEKEPESLTVKDIEKILKLD